MQDSHANGHASFAAADDHTRSREGIDHEPESKRVKVNGSIQPKFEVWVCQVRHHARV